MTSVHLHGTNVHPLKLTVRDDVLTEIGAGYRLTHLTLNQLLVRPNDTTIAVRVANEETELDIIRVTAAVNICHPDGHDLSIEYAGELNPHFATTEGGRGDVTHSANDARAR